MRLSRRRMVPATVVEVIDGDTVRLDLDLGFHISLRMRCRLMQLNAPELGTAAGEAAKAYAQSLLKPGDEVVFFSSSLDKYGRPLGLILMGAEGEDFGVKMIDAGHAVAVK